MIPPHRKTPDYPRSPLAAYIAQVMQLFDPACEGSEVFKVERKCSEIWDKLTSNEKALAVARVQILYTLFGQHTHSPIIQESELPFEDWYMRFADLETRPKEVAREAWRAAKKFQDEKNLQLAQKARLDYMRLEDEVEDACNILSSTRENIQSGVTIHPSAYNMCIERALKALGVDEDEED